VKLLRELRPTVIDRYIVREVLPPTLLGLLLFSFILLLEAIGRLMDVLVSRGADIPTIARIFMNLLPSILATTVPMSFLLGVLLAFGRLAADSEIVALRASGVSIPRLLRPLVVASAMAGMVTLYITTTALPRANQAYREDLFALVVTKARSGIKPRVFTDDLLPGMVLWVSDIPAESGRWHDVFLKDMRNPAKPRLIMARRGRPIFDQEERRARLLLEDGVIHVFDRDQPAKYEEQRFREFESPLDWDDLFPKTRLSRGDREMTPGELTARVAELRQQGASIEEVQPWIVEWHKRFAIPVACLVFGLLGLGLSMGSRKEARSAAFGISVAVIFAYYVLIRLGEQAGDTAMLPPIVAVWGANVVLGAIAGGLLVLHHREPAFDPLNPRHYQLWLPRIRRAKIQGRGGQRDPERPGGRFLGLPTLSILDRYLARAYLSHLWLVLVSFWSIYVLANFMDLFDDVQHNRVKGVTVLHYYLYHTPEIVYLVVPVAALVTPLVTLGVLSRRNEATAMKAGGISLYRAVVPLLSLGCLLSVLVFGLGDYLRPSTNRVAAQDYNVIKGRPTQSSNLLEKRWILGSDQRIYNYDYFSVEPVQQRPVAEGAPSRNATIYSLSVYDLDMESWQLRDRLFAKQARWDGGGYELDNGWRLTLGEATTFRTFSTIHTREIEQPHYFMQVTPESDTLRYAQLSTYIESLESRGLDVTKLRVQLHRKLAFPSVSMVMTVIGIPFAFVVGRRGALYGIGVSIIIAIVYWAALSIFEALGNHALLPPVLAAWAPNIMFGTGGLYLMLTMET
jgi:LPS export ABC transporter permease LptG/LPS export ABC transporter permease LptF